MQGPGLRRKLVELSKVPVDDQSASTEGSVERLSSVVQTRVWSMMQRALFDPSAARKLRMERVDTVDEEEMCEMLLGEENENGTDDGLLDYFDELESRTVESETEEMIFGCGWKDELLLDFESDKSENMLL